MERDMIDNATTGAGGTTNAGTAEVHTHINANPSKGEGMTGKFDASTGGEQGGGMMEEARERLGGATEQARDQMGNVVDRAREQLQNVGDRAGEMASQVRGRASEAFSQLDERTGLVDAIRRNPLPAVGIAFGIGFLLAGSNKDQVGGTFGKAKQQLKGAVMGGVSAAIAQQAREVLGAQGGGLVENLLGNLTGSRPQQRRAGSQPSSSGRGGGSSRM